MKAIKMGLLRLSYIMLYRITILLYISDALLLASLSRRFLIQSPIHHVTLLSSISLEKLPQPNESEIIQLVTGVQYRDVRVGKGEAVQKGDTVVMHIRSLLRDGSVLFDTREDSGPIMLQVGSINDNQFSNDKFTRSRITPGVEDAILSKGFGKPMTGGGIRLAVVPSALAYGNAGISRFDAFRANLRKGVPRDEMIRYEVEILRCIELDQSFANNTTGQVCCTEPGFPCKIDN